MNNAISKIKNDSHSKVRVKEFLELFSEFREKIDLEVDNIDLYIQAFMHSSFVYNLGADRIESNERLEFLGDAVLELMVSDFLFNKFKTLPEGDLTKLRANIVCEPSLVIFATDLKMEEMLLLGPGEEKTGGALRPSIISDMYEAFLGALYLDQGRDKVHKFLSKYVFPKITSKNYSAVVDYKTALQEFVHKHFKDNVKYILVKEEGPSHNKRFTQAVEHNGKIIGEGTGSSKKEAEQIAAKEGLLYLKSKE
ncbi:ribonuclease III [Phocicoccus pinnipedialis]|uniref:Ribonuclease 3 n=1 Tax=Phocicoccus pinnipedialis TaxID=110845 RepID=A0A6V7RI25_9BACL|nr:ribonuclease III [Jeotgalicoccus pinnipedialis]MBP1939089.1 ribonuclease-3 [Jeotgalicoccus pinnipedialis]CAD2076854.1 Ribonuclease 3 [Jeotgalicoccus pinnipedialis]